MVVKAHRRLVPALIVPDAGAWAMWGRDLAALGFRAASAPEHAELMIAPARVPQAFGEAIGAAWARMPPATSPRRAGRRARGRSPARGRPGQSATVARTRSPGRRSRGHGRRRHDGHHRRAQRGWAGDGGRRRRARAAVLPVARRARRQCLPRRRCRGELRGAGAAARTGVLACARSAHAGRLERGARDRARRFSADGGRGLRRSRSSVRSTIWCGCGAWQPCWDGRSSPPRRTRPSVRRQRSRSASVACSAWRFCANAKAALRTMTTTIATASVSTPVASESAAATHSSSASGCVNWPSRLRQARGPLSRRIAFGPTSAADDARPRARRVRRPSCSAPRAAAEPPPRDRARLLLPGRWSQ